MGVPPNNLAKKKITNEFVFRGITPRIQGYNGATFVQNQVVDFNFLFCCKNLGRAPIHHSPNESCQETTKLAGWKKV